MTDRLYTSALALSLSGLTVAGCADVGEQELAPPVAEQTSELIGGVEANSSALDAIGTLVIERSYFDCFSGERIRYLDPVCTASLIAERTAVTAKHCIQALSYEGPDAVPYFAVGPDARNPTRLVEVVATQSSPVDQGGFNFVGRDVAVLHLETALTDLQPLRLGGLSEADVGARFGAIGYGVQGNSGASGTRMAGNVTVNALEGRVFELIFGSFEAYRDWFLNSNGPFPLPIPGPRGPVIVPESPIPGPVIDAGVTPPMPAADAGVPPVVVDAGGVDAGGDDAGSDDAGSDDAGLPSFIEQMLRQQYENTRLLPGYEAYVGNQPGDAQLCHGDSGSPLVRAGEGGLVAYGVVSGGIYSRELVCDYGAVYATFGPETLTFLEEAIAWTDPCGGVSREGTCEGSVATRCTSLDEGSRRLTVTDCALFGQTCSVASNGEAVCATPGEPPVVLEEEDDYCDGFPRFPGGPIVGRPIADQDGEDDIAVAVDDDDISVASPEVIAFDGE